MLSEREKEAKRLMKEIEDEINGKKGTDEPIKEAKKEKKEEPIKESFEDIEVELKKPPVVMVEKAEIKEAPKTKSAKAAMAEPELEGESDLFIKNKPPPYYGDKDVEDVLKAMAKGDFKRPLLLEGEAGTGKTQAAVNFAYNTGIPLVTIQCNRDTSDAELIGHQSILSDGSTAFEIGELPRAVEIANKYGQAILLVDEISALRPEYQKALNALIDDRREVKGNKRAWFLNKDANLIVIATMNPPTYGGTFPLNPDLKNRLAKIYVKYPSKKKEQKILEDYTSDKKLIDKLILLAKYTREQGESNSNFYQVSPRDLKYVVESYESFKKAANPEGGTFAIYKAIHTK